MIASNGTAVFQITTIALLSDRNLAPARLIAVNSDHQHDRDDEPVAVEQARSARLVSMLKCCVHPVDAVDVGDRGEHLDRRDEHRLQPGRPAGGEAGDRAVRVVREAPEPPATG